jgi:hypothetical protein
VASPQARQPGRRGILLSHWQVGWGNAIMMMLTGKPQAQAAVTRSGTADGLKLQDYFMMQDNQ